MGSHESAVHAIVINAEIAFVGSGIRKVFQNKKELHTMKYNEAMATDNAKEWEDTEEE